MADWSEIFERRLQTVLEDGKEQNGKGAERNNSSNLFSGLDFDLTPPPTHQKVPTDPTSAFFESIRAQSRSGSQVATPASTSASTSYAVGSGNYTYQYGDSSSVSSRAFVTPAAQVIRTSSPIVDTNQPHLKGLQESYSTRAEELHGEATRRMANAQGMLEAELGRMAQMEDAFLSAVADKQAHFNRPVEDWMVKVQTRDNNATGGGNGGLVEKDERIVDRIATIRAAATTLESDLEKLWAEWGQAHGEATAVLQAMTGGLDNDNDGDGGDNDEDEERDEILAKAEKELDAAAYEAMKEMKENEKTFKKAIFAEECKLAQMMLSRQSKYD